MVSDFNDDNDINADDDLDFIMLDVDKAVAASANKSAKRAKKNITGRKRGSQTHSSNSRQKRISPQGQVWSAKHKPRSTSGLAVHNKKVEEVKGWLKVKLAAKRSGGLLFLRGPPGAGKTATVHVLASEFGLDLREWTMPTETVSFKAREDEDGLPFLHGDSVAYVSQARAFEDFLRRATTYGSVFGGRQGALVLIEDLPPFARRNKEEFKRILLNHIYGYHPIVVVATDSSGGSKDRSGATGEEMALELGADVITFNAATTTNLVKALSSIAEKEATGSGFHIPDRDTLASLAEASKGDIRAAINALQFASSTGSSMICSLSIILGLI